MKKPVEIKQTEPPVPTEVLADAIVTIADAIRTMRNGRLNDRAIIILIQSACTYKVSQQTIKEVLDAAEGLAKTYTRKG